MLETVAVVAVGCWLLILTGVIIFNARGAGGWLRRVSKHQIVLHTTQDQTIVGSLIEAFPDGVVLRAAVLKGPTPASQDTPLAGETFVPRERIAFCQFDE